MVPKALGLRGAVLPSIDFDSFTGKLYVSMGESYEHAVLEECRSNDRVFRVEIDNVEVLLDSSEQ